MINRSKDTFFKVNRNPLLRVGFLFFTLFCCFLSNFVYLYSVVRK